MASRTTPAKKSARSLSAWRAKNPTVAKLLARRVLSVERQIDQDDQRLFELNSELIEVRNRMEKRTRAAALALSDLAQRLKSAERNLAMHEQLIGHLASIFGGKLLSVEQVEAAEKALREYVTSSAKSQSATTSSKGSRNRISDSQSET